MAGVSRGLVVGKGKVSSATGAVLISSAVPALQQEESFSISVLGII